MSARAHERHIPVAVYEISSGSVAGAHGLVRSKEIQKEPALVLAQERIDSPLEETGDISRYVEKTVGRLLQVSESIRVSDHHQPESVVLVLGAPWYISQTRTINLKKNASFVCTQKMVDELLDKEIAYMLEHEKDAVGNLGTDHIIVEKQLSSIKLNGYVTHAPFGKKAQSLELFMSVTIAPKEVVNRFKDILSRIYGDRPITVTTGPYAAYIALRDHATDLPECVIVDVGEEVTDVAFVKDHTFLYQHSFPLGSHGLYRTLGSMGGHTILEAKALLEAFRLGKVSASTKEIDTAVKTFHTQWQKGFQKVLDEGSYGFCLPEKCMIVADPRFGALFHDAIKTDPFVQHVCMTGMVNPKVVDAQMLTPHIKSLTKNGVDVPLALGLLFGERLITHTL